MRPRLPGAMTALAFGAVLFLSGGVGNAASAGNDDRALLLDWQASCVARLKAAAREADGVEPGFSAATTFSTGLASPPYQNKPGVYLVYATARGKDHRNFRADVIFSNRSCCVESGWRLEGPHGPLSADGEGAPEAELRMLSAHRNTPTGVLLEMDAYKVAADRALAVYRIFRPALDECAATIAPELAARTVSRGGAPAPQGEPSPAPPAPESAAPPFAIVIVHADPEPHRKGDPKDVKFRVVNQSKKPATLFLNSGDPFGPGAFSVAVDDSDWLPIEVEHRHDGKLITRTLAPGHDYLLSLGPDLQFRGHVVKVRYLTDDKH